MVARKPRWLRYPATRMASSMVSPAMYRLATRRTINLGIRGRPKPIARSKRLIRRILGGNYEKEAGRAVGVFGGVCHSGHFGYFQGPGSGLHLCAAGLQHGRLRWAWSRGDPLL